MMTMKTGYFSLQEWMAGDVIGCCIDLDEGTISYSRSVSPDSKRNVYDFPTHKNHFYCLCYLCLNKCLVYCQLVSFSTLPYRHYYSHLNCLDHHHHL